MKLPLALLTALLLACWPIAQASRADDGGRQQPTPNPQQPTPGEAFKNLQNKVSGWEKDPKTGANTIGERIKSGEFKAARAELAKLKESLNDADREKAKALEKKLDEYEKNREEILKNNPKKGGEIVEKYPELKKAIKEKDYEAVKRFYMEKGGLTQGEAQEKVAELQQTGVVADTSGKLQPAKEVRGGLAKQTAEPRPRPPPPHSPRSQQDGCQRAD